MVGVFSYSHNSHQKSHMLQKKLKYGLYNMGWWNSKQYVVDSSDTEYLDSSAPSMLLLQREHTGGGSLKIDIIQASAEVKKILNVANFGKLFNI